MASSYAHTHPALPVRLGVAAARRRGLRLLGDPRARARAHDAMQAITGGRLGRDELEALTAAHLVEMEVRNEFFWRPRTFARARIEGEQHLRAALDSGRGVIVSFCHFGPAFAMPILLGRYGRTVHVVSGGGHFKQDKTGEAADRQRQQHRLRRGGTTVEAQGSFETLAGLLREGELVCLNLDIGGRTPTAFLGHTLDLASGTSRLAAETDALAVPLMVTRDEHRLVAVFGAALDPRSFDDGPALHTALARHHDAWIATDPAALSLTANVQRQLGLKRHSRTAAPLRARTT